MMQMWKLNATEYFKHQKILDAFNSDKLIFNFLTVYISHLQHLHLLYIVLVDPGIIGVQNLSETNKINRPK